MICSRLIKFPLMVVSSGRVSLDTSVKRRTNAKGSMMGTDSVQVTRNSPSDEILGVTVKLFATKTERGEISLAMV